MGSLPCLLSDVSEDYKGAMHLSSLIIGELGEGAAAAAAAAVAWDSRPIEFLASSDRWPAAVVAASGHVVLQVLFYYKY
jgi:hypothetical protein